MIPSHLCVIALRVDYIISVSIHTYKYKTHFFLPTFAKVGRYAGVSGCAC